MKTITMLVGGLLNAIALNFFLVPSNVYSSGFAGLSQLISSIFDRYFSIDVSTGIIVFLLNIPVTIIAWKIIGKSFTFYSFLSVVFMSLFLEIIPIVQVTPDILLSTIAGGVISAVGIGLTLKMGASTGGLDIIALILSKTKDRPIGTYFLVFNGIIIVVAGQLNGWELALYTLVSIYVASRVIDAIHTSHVKLTAFIITNKGDEMKKAIHATMVRGITAIPAKGAYTNSDKEVLMIVLTRYELYTLEKVIKTVDQNAFTNIMETVNVFGLFRKS